MSEPNKSQVEMAPPSMIDEQKTQADEEANSDASKKATTKSLPINWHIPENQITPYANEIAVQNLHTEFILSFFEVRPLLLSGTLEQQKDQIKKLEELQAYCVARVAISVQRIPEFIKILQDRFNELMEQVKLEENIAKQEVNNE